MSAPETFLQLRIFFEQIPGGCSFKYLDGIRKPALRSGLYEHVCMIRHGFHGNDFYILFIGKIVKYLFKISICRTGEYFITILCTPDYMILKTVYIAPTMRNRRWYSKYIFFIHIFIIP